VTQRAVVAVVEARELGGHDPDRREEREQEGCLGAAPPQSYEGRGHGDRENVGHGEETP